MGFRRRADQFAVTAGNNALRALIIINGGAAVAMLAFIGHLVSAGNGKLILTLPLLTAPLEWFGWGVALATLGTGFGYLTNFSLGRASGEKKFSYRYPYVAETEKSRKARKFVVGFQWCAMIATGVSLYSFVYGMIEIQAAVGSLTVK
jgi:membrane protein YqaA with SNARE-associated domain